MDVNINTLGLDAILCFLLALKVGEVRTDFDIATIIVGFVFLLFFFMFQIFVVYDELF